MHMCCAFALTEKVIVDGCRSIPCIITAICYRHTGCKVEISYWDEGKLLEAWVDDWRLSRWEEE